MAIVCGTDFSKQGAEAVTAAAAIAGRLGATLHLLHVFEAEREQWGPADEEKVRTTLQARLQDEEKRVSALAKGRVKSLLLTGWADQELMRYAEHERAALLVVSSVGHRASPLVRLGGTSERLALSPRVPLLVIRDAGPFTAWGEGRRPLRTLLAVDESPGCAGALAMVRKLRQAGPIDTVCGSVYYADEARKRYGLHTPIPFAEKDASLEEMLRRDLHARTGELDGQGEVTFRVHRGVGRIADHLLELAEAERADLVVCGTTGRRGVSRMWSTSQAVLHVGHVAVLAVPASLAAQPAEARIPTFKRVLVPVDFSATSGAAVPWAYGLVPPRSGEVILAHVVPGPSLATEIVSLYVPITGNVEPSSLKAEIISKLRALVPEDAVREGYVTRIEVVESPEPARSIAELAERLGVDAICIGSHGRSGLSRALVGSVAEQVIRQSRRPVLVVRPPG